MRDVNSEDVTVCLNMIVKNEAPVIARCLENVRPLIDAWVIVDTGSEDGTQDIIRTVMADIPGELHERPWKNFGHNRSEAVALCAGKADYILTIDADETLERDPGFRWGALAADSYLLLKRRGARQYRAENVLRTDRNWRWEGVVHEYPVSDLAQYRSALDGLVIVSPREGARARDAQTYRRDALMLEQALLENPDDARSVFYLAQSYRDADDYDLALRHYHARVDMGGWREEVYVALYEIARCMQRRGDDWADCQQAYLRAYNHSPFRAEPLFRIGMAYAYKKEWSLAWLFLSRAAQMPEPHDDALFVERDAYGWSAKLEAAVAAYWIGTHEEAIALNEAVIAMADTPDHIRARSEHNLALSLDAKSEGLHRTG